MSEKQQIDFNAMASLSPWHYVQIIGTMGLTAGTTALATWLISKGMAEDDAKALAVAVAGLVAAFAFSVYQRRQLLNTPAPTQAVITLTPNDEATQPTVVGNTTRTLVLLFAVMLLIGGCATSPSFKAGMRGAGPLLADEAAAYTAGDGFLNVVDAGVQAGQAERLKIETAGKCEYPAVKAAWLEVRPWYLRYVQQDERLTEVERAIVLKTASQVDGLIGEEAARRRIMFLPE